MKYVKAFIAGLAFPATVFPILYSGVYLGSQGQVRTVPVQFFPLFIPLVFGLWNDLYFLIGKRCPVKDRNLRLWAYGAILGFLVARGHVGSLPGSEWHHTAAAPHGRWVCSSRNACGFSCNAFRKLF